MYLKPAGGLMEDLPLIADVPERAQLLAALDLLQSWALWRKGMDTP